MKHLSKEFWTERYENNSTGWDLGGVSPPLKDYIDQLQNKELKILIPGCGNAYEAEYLHRQGFSNVHIVDLSEAPLENLKKRIPDFPNAHIHQSDFFVLEGNYDIILEQTMFCAIDPSLRDEYVKKCFELLKPGGKLVGVLFSKEFPEGPPYGGSKEEYIILFKKLFSTCEIEDCYNSVEPRQGSELFIKISKD